MNLTQVETGWLTGITGWLKNAGPSAIFFIIKVLAVWTILLVPLILLIVFFFSAFKKPALNAFLAALIGWQLLDRLVALIWFRPRPELTLLSSKELIFERTLYSFPSDHATVFTALILSFWLSGLPRLSYFLIVIAILNLLPRVLTGLHYPTDILAGILIGVVSVFLVKLFKPALDNFVFNPLLSILKKIKLA